MQTFTTTTGLGYFENSNGILSKAKLKPGTHKMKDGLTFSEVQTVEELQAIVIDMPESEKNKDEKLISKRIRKLAITSLQEDGLLPGDFEAKQIATNTKPGFLKGLTWKLLGRKSQEVTGSNPVT